MKKIILISIAVVALLALLISWAIHAWPVRIQTTLEGVLTRGGISSFSEEYTLEIDGRYYRNLFRDDEFLGTFAIKEIELRKDFNREETVSIRFDENGRGHLYYPVEEPDGGPGIYYVSMVFMDIKDMKVAMGIHEETASGQSGWGSSGGLIFAAPAKSRSQAIEITNELMDEILILPIK